jgi:hypothetical protein
MGLVFHCFLAGIMSVSRAVCEWAGPIFGLVRTGSVWTFIIAVCMVCYSMLRQRFWKGARNFELFLAKAKMARKGPKTLRNFTGQIRAWGSKDVRAASINPEPRTGNR